MTARNPDPRPGTGKEGEEGEGVSTKQVLHLSAAHENGLLHEITPLYSTNTASIWHDYRLGSEGTDTRSLTQADIQMREHNESMNMIQALASM